MKKTILITGSTDGIGKLSAIKLAKDGHEIYLHGRNTEKLSEVITEIKQLSKNEDINGFVADFSDLESVKKMSQQVNHELSKLDILINNAGIYKSAVFHNAEGLDIRLTVNYLAPYLLTHELIPLLKKGTNPRIINLSSAAQATVESDVLLGKIRRSEGETYAQSKLALTMWSFQLAKSNPDMVVIAVNPGSLLNTKMVKEAYGKHWSSADKGANILYDLATLDAYKEDSGKYFDNDKGAFSSAHPDAYDPIKVEKLMSTTDSLLES